MFKNNKVYLLLITILLVVLLFNILKRNKETFRLFFWHDTPTSKNSSYDLRGDPFKIRPKNTGIYYYSSYIPDNHTNSRLDFN